MDPCDINMSIADEFARSVTLVLREMDGVAYTTGSDLDNDHKEIHFNTSYIAGVPEDRRRKECRSPNLMLT